MYIPSAVIAITISLAGLMHGCGGGGSASSGSSEAPPTQTTVSVGGTVTGLRSQGLVLQLNSGQTAAIAADGAFTFAQVVPSGSTYTTSVASQPAGQVCSVQHGNGTTGPTNVSDLAVTCTDARAGLLAYDGFEYEMNKVLVGANQGIGWTSAWRVVSGYSSSDVSLAPAGGGAIVEGLNFVDGSGHRLDTTGAVWQTDPVVFFGQVRRSTSSSFG